MPRERWGLVRGWWARSGAECVLALVAALGFLGALGSTELWGRREQRAAAEAVDTVAHGHWLVGSIQGRARLEKPPLPRWVGASLMILTARRDEAIVRLPDACAGLALVAIAVAWGRAVGGRSVGLASGFALAATPFFLVEMRQAGNDGLLALAVGGALWAALRRWGAGEPGFERPGSAGWAWAFHLALGLGFLCKGPVAFLWVLGPVAGVLASRGELRPGLRLLRSGPGLGVLVALVVGWPLAVAVRYPAAWGVWALEIGQKAGGLGVEHGNARGSILAEALVAALPGTPLVLAALVGPVRRWRGRRVDPGGASGPAPTPAPLALAWWWAFGPLAAIGAWDVAKPNYLLPAAPAWAILAGSGWIRLASRARQRSGGLPSRLALQATWSGALTIAVAGPVAVEQVAPRWLGAATGAGLALGLAAVAGAWLWHRGRDAASLGALASGLVAVVLLGYGVVAPTQNATRGHRLLAGELARLLPADAPAWFLDDLDEGVWFYGPGLDLRPVPGPADAPSTSRGHALRSGVEPHQSRAQIARARSVAAAGQVAAWAEASGPGAHLLIRAKLLDHLAADLPPTLAPVYREAGVGRNAVALLRVRTPAEVAALPPATRR